MKTIIAGSKDIDEYVILQAAIKAIPWEITEVVSGRARGADYLGELYAEENELPLHKFPADWKKNGRSAGYIRNSLMADNAEALLALWDGKSRGTANMIKQAENKNLEVYVWIIQTA